MSHRTTAEKADHLAKLVPTAEQTSLTTDILPTARFSNQRSVYFWLLRIQEDPEIMARYGPRVRAALQKMDPDFEFHPDTPDPDTQIAFPSPQSLFATHPLQAHEAEILLESADQGMESIQRLVDELLKDKRGETVSVPRTLLLAVTCAAASAQQDLRTTQTVLYSPEAFHFGPSSR